MSSVVYLQSINFASLNLYEQNGIKNRGRPTPNLNITKISKSNSKEYQRKFKSDIYLKHKWLCGCDTRNAFFCFPCLLYNGDTSWTKSGVKDLVHIQEKIRKHEASSQHMKNVMDLALLGKVNIIAHINNVKSVIKHNEEVRKNRAILSKMIDCIKFCTRFQLPLHVNEEIADLRNSSVFCGLLEFTGNLDDPLKYHFNNSALFKSNVKTIQHELLDCMLQVCHDKICNEIEKAKFVSIMSDDTTNISEYTQQVIVFRYELQGAAKERFWGFFDLNSQNVQSLSSVILQQLKIVLKDNTDKLIAQSYDGAAAISNNTDGIQNIIKSLYRFAHFVHSYAHHLNVIMEKAASQNHSMHMFLSNLSGIPAFFSRSPIRSAALDKIYNRILPDLNTGWNFDCGVINTVYENIDIFKECFEELLNSKHSSTTQEATSLLHILNDKDFIFWLSFFHRIMHFVNVLQNQFQSRNLTSMSVVSALEDFYNVLLHIKNDVPVKIDEEQRETETSKEKNWESKLITATEVCDVIWLQASERLKFTNHLAAAQLLNFNTSSYPPENELQETIAAYPFLNEGRLRTELSVLHQCEREEFKQPKSIIQIYKSFLKNGLENTFEETCTLLSIIISTPMTIIEPEWNFSRLKRVKTFLYNTITEENLNALAMLNIEKELVQETASFNELVIEKFVQKNNHCFDFIERR